MPLLLSDVLDRLLLNEMLLLVDSLWLLLVDDSVELLLAEMLLLLLDWLD